MKVLFVCRGIPFYGISPIMLRQGESLIKKGIDIEYFKIEGKGILGYFKSIFKLRNYLSKRKFDIIHAHYGLCGIVVLFAKRTERTVLSFMGSELFGKDKKEDWSLADFVSLKVNNYCVKKFNALIVKSEVMANALKDKHCNVIPNGVNLEKFYPINKVAARKKIDYNSENKLIIFISDPPNRVEKNQELAKAAVSILNDHRIELKLLNKIEQDVLNYYYSAADLLILTSFHEGSPNVIKEAMACGCPIVATDVGDIKQNISGVEGCYLTSFDKTDVAEKIKMAIDFNEIQRRTKGRERIIQLKIDSDSISNKITEVYDFVLSNEKFSGN